MRRLVKVIKDAEGVFPEYMPEVGKVYEAEHIPRTRGKNGVGVAEFCVIDMLDKKIILRGDEFEVVGNCEEKGKEK
jgi:hypothetical protein